jgi:hypothetical protein
MPTQTQPTYFDSSRYVQRLRQPTGLAGNPFAFGAGKRNGGIAGNVMMRLDQLFSFEYMGSAEYEFGAAAQAIETLRDHVATGDVLAWSFSPPLTKIEPSDTTPPTAVIYVIAPPEHRVEIESRITTWANERWSQSLKEAIFLAHVLRQLPDEDLFETCGWLELNNGFFFFSDRVMFEGVANFLGAEATE